MIKQIVTKVDLIWELPLGSHVVGESNCDSIIAYFVMGVTQPCMYSGTI